MLTKTKAAIGAVLALAASAASAQTSIDASLAAFSSEADLVFQGTVADIQYAPSIEGIPHTFVTYRVEEVFKGSYRAPTLTLRFIGGVKIEGNVMRRLSVSHAPRFETGHQDLLMVKDNTQVQCPLVHCAQGRFRFDQGLVTTDSGEVLARGARGRVLALPRPQQQVAPGDIGVRESTPQNSPPATPFDRGSFVAHLRQVIGQQAAPARAAQVQSADPAQPFEGPAPAVSAPPRQLRALAPGAGASRPQSEHDRLELEALQRNGGNPVLPPKDAETLRRIGSAPAKPSPR